MCRVGDGQRFAPMIRATFRRMVRAAGPADASSDGTPPKALRILVVEDSVGVRELERSLLVGAGYEVDTAVDGVDGAVVTSECTVVTGARVVRAGNRCVVVVCRYVGVVDVEYRTVDPVEPLPPTEVAVDAPLRPVVVESAS